MLGTYSEWMLGLPLVPQLVVVMATLMAIGTGPLLIWLGFQVISTGDRPQGGGANGGRGSSTTS